MSVSSGRSVGLATAIVVLLAAGVLAVVWLAPKTNTPPTGGLASPLPEGTVTVTGGYTPTPTPVTEYDVAGIPDTTATGLTGAFLTAGLTAQQTGPTTLIVAADDTDAAADLLTGWQITPTSRSITAPAAVTPHPIPAPAAEIDTPSPPDLTGTGGIPAAAGKPVKAIPMDADNPWHMASTPPSDLRYPVTRITVPTDKVDAVTAANVFEPSNEAKQDDTIDVVLTRSTVEPGVFLLPGNLTPDLINRIYNVTDGRVVIDQLWWMTFTVPGALPAAGLPHTTSGGDSVTYDGPALTKTEWYDYGRTVAELLGRPGVATR